MQDYLYGVVAFLKLFGEIPSQNILLRDQFEHVF